MSKAITGVAIGAAIIGLAVATGGISLAPTLTIAGTTATVATGVGAATALTVGAATIATGALISTTALGAIALSIGASMAISGISAQLSSPKVPSAQVDRLNLQSDPKAFRKTALGSTAFPLDVRYQEWNGPDQDISDLIVVCAGHKVESFDEIWINDELAWTSAGGAVGKFVGYFFADWIREGGPGQGFDLPGGRWHADEHRLTGCAYGHFRFKTTGTTKKAKSPFSGGVPSRMTVIGKGGMMYDPRRDTTVAGGSGPMRAGDQSTWRYFADDGPELGTNIPLAILRVMLGWRIANPATGEMKLSVGAGIPRKRLHLESFLTAANLADELVTKTSGGTEPRFAGAITYSEGDEPQQVIDALCAACNGRIVEIGGKLGLVIAHNDLAAAATDPGLNDDDVIGDFVWNPDPALDQCPNVVSGNYTDPSSNSLYQQIPYPEARLPSVDGIDRIFPLDLTAIESSTQAERISSQVLQRKQYDRTFTATFDIRAWQYGQGDVLPFTYAPLSFVRQLCRVVDQEYTQDGRCAMTLRIEHPAIYAWDGGNGALVQPAAPNVYDTRNSAIIQGIDEAGETAAWSKVLDDDPANHPKPEDGADVTADHFVSVWTDKLGRSPQSVITELSTASQSVAEEIMRGGIFRVDTDEIIKNPDGSSIRETVDAIVVSTGGIDAVYAFIQDLRSVGTDGTVKAVRTLNSNGYVSGSVQLNNGQHASEYIIADEWGLVDPADASDPNSVAVKPFYYIDGVLYIRHAKVQELDVDVVNSSNVIGNSLFANKSVYAGQQISGVGSAPSTTWQTAISYNLILDSKAEVTILMVGGFSFSASADYELKIFIDGSATRVGGAGGAGFPQPTLTGIGTFEFPQGSTPIQARLRASEGATLVDCGIVFLINYNAKKN